ncbi:MAG: hypothetical protein JWM75_2009 [Sphingomonas bacterium]|nr:hypothetical protein [Sphingomonas bacterium]
MEELSLKSRAVAFALCAGVLVFILALLGLAQGGPRDHLVIAILVALACGVMAWAAAVRATSGIAISVDQMAARLIAAAEGDLESPMPRDVVETLPTLARAMESLFGRIRTNIDTIRTLALFDPVTKLPNGINFRTTAERALRESADGEPAAMLFVDLDRFKSVNDKLGHAHGDQLLLMVANRLRHIAGDALASGLVVARLAGDEFTLFAPHTDADAAVALGERVLTALAAPFDLAAHRLELGASVGIAIYPRDGRDLAALMRAADVAMYHAKAEGRGQLQLFTPALAAPHDERLTLDHELRRAMQDGEFELYFQPQTRARDGALASVEALLRWRHPTRGVRLPADFLAAAEASGLFLQIGDWVLEEAAATLGRWVAMGRTEHLTVNISPRQIAQPDFFANLTATLRRHRAPPELFGLEIGEMLAMECSPAVIAGIAAARRRGITIAVDDFGNGLSNLARLKDLPLDRIKLDRSLIRDVAESGASRTLVHSVVALVHALGCEVVAVGVEQHEQAEVLRAIGCDLIQGYAVAAPMGELEFLARWSTDPGMKMAIAV